MKKLSTAVVLALVLVASAFGQSSPLAIANDLSEESTTLAIAKLPTRGQVTVFIDGITSEGRTIPLGAVFTAKTRTALISRMGTRITVVTELARADFVIRGEVYPLGDEAVFAITLEDRRNGTILGGFDRTVELDQELRRQITATGATGSSDPYEPNNSAFDGFSAELGATLSDATLGSPGDNDWYLLEVGESANPIMITAGTRGGIDTVIEVYGPDDSSEYIGENDDAEDSNARFTFTPEFPGVYYILVRGYGSDTTGPYTFYTEVQEANPDSFEPDGDADRATLIQEGRNYAGHSLSPSGDADWFRIEVPRGGEVILNVGTSGILDTVIQLYDAEEVLVAENDDFMDQNAQVQHLTSGGSFYAVVRGYDSATLGDYEISYWTEEAIVDDYEPDNSFSEAGELVPDSSPQDHTFVPATDYDYFTFTLEAESYVVIETDGDIDTYIRLYDQFESLITEDDDSGFDFNSKISTDLGPGRYYIEVYQLNEVSGGEYSIGIETYSR